MLQRKRLDERSLLEPPLPGSEQLRARQIVRAGVEVVDVERRGVAPGHSPLKPVSDAESRPDSEPPVALEHGCQRHAHVRFDRRPPWWEEMEAESARLQNAPDLAECGVMVLHVLEHLVRDDEIESGVSERQAVWDLDQTKPLLRSLEDDVATVGLMAGVPPGADGRAVAAPEIENRRMLGQRGAAVGGHSAKEANEPPLLMCAFAVRIVVLHLAALLRRDPAPDGTDRKCPRREAILGGVRSPLAVRASVASFNTCEATGLRPRPRPGKSARVWLRLPKRPNCMATASFLITIDTEGDNVWGRPRHATTQNAGFLERFQQLCEQYGQRPTWLTNHEMILSPVFQRFARDVLGRGTAEIGMHLHAWDSPPLVPLTTDDAHTQPYLVEYEPRVMREKIHALTGRLEDELGVKMISHRAGRWALDERYAEMLIDQGYKVDCSVTPLVSWASIPGDPSRSGGPDYSRFPHNPYWIDLADISRPGSSTLLEVPVTIVSTRPAVINRLVRLAESLPPSLAGLRRLTHRAADRLAPTAAWLRPTRRNHQQLLSVVDRVLADGSPHAEFMLHSSELMPGGSPTFPDNRSIETLYGELEALFQSVQRRFRAATLSQFHDEIARGRS